MTEVFADTFYWTALTHPAEQFHQQALGFDAQISRGGLVTTEEVLVEYLNLFSKQGPYWRSRAVAVVRALRGQPNLKILPQRTAGFAEGLDLYAARLDKGYSLTDCISMQAMRRAGITDVLTQDRHFEQEGFRALFRETSA
ncbi:MAG: PIN domain-containing protein [Bryobacterales bacterium]|nr:PIN domain-containing protein [Acidobacteriota bacterium]MCB9384794.1 PIN domain-containing protein [Bryobacterales bacterium]